MNSKLYVGFAEKFKNEPKDNGFNLKNVKITRKPFDVEIFDSSKGLLSSFTADGQNFACRVGKWKHTAPEGFIKTKGDDIVVVADGFVLSVSSSKGVVIEKA